MTLDEAYARFRDALTTRNYTATTRDHYRRDIGWFLDWLGAGAGLREVTTVTRAEIERYQAHLADRARPQPLALQTQASRIRAVKRWFEWLVERGFLFESPTRGIVETPKGMNYRRCSRWPRSRSSSSTRTPRRLAASGTVRCFRGALCDGAAPR
ncbi:MAG: phage integrase N-terminal SAM-like domain-containing protein [Deltaproteobacteria bacterium]|nr:phage integrase N-terminal SAM-like domain-containing protein [Deltaproteobacteria bacterium]